MSDAEVPKPVEAVPEAAPAQPTEEKTVEKTEEKTEVKPEEKAEEASEKKPEESKSANILKTTAKIDHENHRNNRKFDPSIRDVTDDPDAIRKQVKTDTMRYAMALLLTTSRSNSTLATGISPRTSLCGSRAVEPRTSP